VWGGIGENSPVPFHFCALHRRPDADEIAQRRPDADEIAQRRWDADEITQHRQDADGIKNAFTPFVEMNAFLFKSLV